MIRWSLPVFSAIAALSGCGGYDCQSTCNHVYADSECGIATGQVDESEAIQQCTATCQDALSKTGDLGDYDPYIPYRGGTPPTLNNEKQAARWMECVWDSAPDEGFSANCVLLSPEEGFCAPI